MRHIARSTIRKLRMQAAVIADMKLTPDVALFGVGMLTLLELVEHLQTQVGDLQSQLSDAREEEEAGNQKQWKENRVRIWEAVQASRLSEETDPEVRAGHQRFLAAKTADVEDGPTPRIEKHTSASNLKNVMVNSVYEHVVVIGASEAEVLLRNNEGFRWAMRYPVEGTEWWAAHFTKKISPLAELRHVGAVLLQHEESRKALMDLLGVSSIDLMHNDAIFASYGGTDDRPVEAGNDGAGVESNDSDPGVASTD